MALDDIPSDVVPAGGIKDGQPVAGEAEASTGQQNAETGEQAGEQVAEGEQPFRWDNVPKELEPHVKHFQADYTRKSQELAEQRKALEAQQQQYSAYAALEQLAQQDPALARQILAARMGLTDEGVQAAGGETDPYGQLELTETERLLATQLQQMDARLQQQQQFYEQQVRQQQRVQIDAEFASLSRAIGREIPPEEQQRIAAFSLQHNGIPVEVAYRAMDYDNALSRARQEGLNQGASVVQQKAGMAPAPSTAADRAGRVTELSRDLGELAAAAADAAGI